MVWYGTVNVDLYSAVITKVFNALPDPPTNSVEAPKAIQLILILNEHKIVHSLCKLRSVRRDDCVALSVLGE